MADEKSFEDDVLIGILTLEDIDEINNEPYGAH